MDRYGESKNVDELANSFPIKPKACNVEVLLPVDRICHTTCNPTGSPFMTVTKTENAPNGYMALDIGPRKIELYQDCISQCRTAM